MSEMSRILGVEPVTEAKPRYRSPNRKEMAKLCAGRRVGRKVYEMKNAPTVLEEDKVFFERFQTSKKLEAVLSVLRAEPVPDIAAIAAAQDAFNAAREAVTARIAELIPEARHIP